MATKAKRAQLLQIAFSSPFHNWHDMIRIPECLTGKPLRPPSLKEFFRCVAGSSITLPSVVMAALALR